MVSVRGPGWKASDRPRNHKGHPFGWPSGGTQVDGSRSYVRRLAPFDFWLVRPSALPTPAALDAHQALHADGRV